MNERKQGGWRIDDGRRLAVLHETGVIDGPPDKRLDDLTAVAREICVAPLAFVSLVDAERQWFVAAAGWSGERSTSVDTSVCALAIRQDQLFVIEDLAADPRTREFSLVTGGPQLRFYAGFPIMTEQGFALGSLCVIDPSPRPGGLTGRQGIALEALARQAAREIERIRWAVG